jgi:hypothetical protein
MDSEVAGGTVTAGRDMAAPNRKSNRLLVEER